VKLDFLALLQAGVLGIQKLEDFRSRLKPVQIFAARKKISRLGQSKLIYRNIKI
jgi:hypothetical protein